MKRILFVSSVIVLLSASSMAHAQDTVDVTKITSARSDGEVCLAQH
jgi:hypothetical protein